MEPVDPRMGDLLGGGDPAGGGPEDLHAIVARAGRRMRIRAAAMAGAIAVVVGGGVGYAVSTTGASTKQVVATSQGSGGNAAARAPGAADIAGSPAAPSVAPAEAAKLTRLFTRTGNGVDVRGFLGASPLMLPESANPGMTCEATGSHLQAELSSPGMVAVVGGGFVTQDLGSKNFADQPYIVGESEGDPVAVVIVETGPSVAKVRVDFAGGTADQMVPVQGWSALVSPAPWYQPAKTSQVALGTLTTFDSSGRALASKIAVWPPGEFSGGAGGTGSGGSVGSASGSGTATANSGTASSGTASSGTASTGTVSSGPASSGGATPGTTSNATSTPPGIVYPCQEPPAVPPCASPPNATACPEPAPLPAATPSSAAPKPSTTVSGG